MPVLLCDDEVTQGQQHLLHDQHTDRNQVGEPATSCVTYYLSPEEKAGPAEGGAGPPGARAGPNWVQRRYSAHPTPNHATFAACYEEHNDGLFYAVLGLSRSLWSSVLTSQGTTSVTSDVMDQGVATQCRAGDVLSEDECRGEAHTGTWVVNGAPWTLPCSLSSLLAMNCRARAEALARRLQERVRGVDVEQTSLVGPHEDHYATLECRRHASLDGPDLGTFAEHNMRPIHVVTSEPTLHLSLPELPPPELDSDVYYDFDIASPDDTTEQAESREGMTEEEEEDKKKDMEDVDEGQAEEEEEERRAREKPESGCVTSVTSPVMFDDYDLDEDGVDDNLPSSQELCLPSSDSSLPLTSPDADLCAVRKILSTTSLTEGHCCPGNEVMTGQQCNSSSPSNHCIDIECCEIGKCCPDSCRESEKSACECSSDSSEESNVWEYFPGNSARDCAIKHIAQPQVASTVAAQLAPEVCWCHTSTTIQSASSVPAGDTINGDDPAEVGGGATAAAANSASIRCGAVNKLLSSEEKSYHCECYNNPVVINSDKIDDDDDDGSECVSEVVIDCVKVISDDEEETLLLLTEEVPAAFRDTVLLPAGGHDESGEMELGRGEEGEVAGDESNGPNDALSVATSVRRADTISGASSPPTLLPHLCLTSEGQLETAMEARGDHEADLREPHGIFGMESEGEEIETLGEDEMSEEDENEEDVEEEAIMTGKFRNFRRYTERVRRLSDEVEDRISPTKIVYCDDPSLPVYDSDSSHLTQDEDEDEEVTDSRHTPQLSEKDIEDQENLQLEDEDEEEDVGAGTRSSSEETDPEKVEEFKMRIKRSSSLKCGKTPPGTPGRKKIVRFADMLGLDLAAVRTFLAGVPHVPRSAFWDLELEREAAEAAAVAASNLGQPPPLPRRVLTPLFQEPALQPGFMDRVRQQKVVLESVVVGDDMSVRGVVRVLNIDFHKNVYVRYTFDHWRNFHETTATYLPGSHDGLTDRFSILLWGSFLKDDGALVFCIRYNTHNQDFWDNNYGRNYVLQCYTRGSSEAAEAEVPQRPQNSSSVQQQQQQQHHYTSSGGAGSSGNGGYRSSFGGRVDSPPTPGDPWTTIFF